MLYAHGSDLCHDLELKHAMANCFEALMGALFLDGGIDVADQVFSNTLFRDNQDLLKVSSSMLSVLQVMLEGGLSENFFKFEVSMLRYLIFERAENNS